METHGTKNRQRAIAEIVKNHEVGSQAELIALLASNYGIQTTQAVVSRDLKVLGVSRVIRDTKRIYALPEQDVEKEILKLGIKDIQHNEALIVITTPPGLAPYVGDAVDAADLEILGSLAGENMVFVTPNSIKEIKTVYHQLCQALYFTPGESS